MFGFPIARIRYQGISELGHISEVDAAAQKLVEGPAAFIVRAAGLQTDTEPVTGDAIDTLVLAGMSRHLGIDDFGRPFTFNVDMQEPGMDASMHGASKRENTVDLTSHVVEEGRAEVTMALAGKYYVDQIDATDRVIAQWLSRRRVDRRYVLPAFRTGEIGQGDRILFNHYGLDGQLQVHLFRTLELPRRARVTNWMVRIGDQQ
jgi:hypothetical protein